MTPTRPLHALTMTAAALLAILAAPGADAQRDLTACSDPQFPLGPVITDSVPEGSYWAPNGEYHVYGSTSSRQLWADNRAGVGSVCVKHLEDGTFDWCLNCVA